MAGLLHSSNRMVWLPLALAACLGACASLAGRQQVVAIDSPVRGVAVLDEQGRALGTTPVFVQVPRQRHLVLRSASAASVQSIQCDYRPLSSMLPNAILASMITQVGMLPVAALFAVGNGTDLWTGAAFDCPDVVLLPGDNTPTAPGEAAKCRTILVAPAQHDDPQVARDLTDRWWQQHVREFPCDRRVDADLAESLLRRQGLGHDRQLDPSKQPRQLLNRLGLRSGASHVAILPTKIQDDAVLVTPTVWDLFTLQKEAGEPLAVDLQLRRKPMWQRALAWAGQHIDILPDSVGYAPTGKAFAMVGTGGQQVTSVELAPSTLPAVLGNWSLLSVEHPGAFRPWDLSWSLGPRVLFGYGAAVVHLRDSTTVSQREATLLNLGGLFGVTGTAHTPLGALSLYVGLGWAPTWHWDQGRYVGFRGPTVASGGLAWTAFVTENAFVRAEMSSFETDQATALGPGYGLWRWTTVSMTAGWYMPEWRSWLRGLW